MSTDGLSWRKLQRHERTDHRLWPLLQRALRDHLLRLPDSLDGVIFERTKRPVDDLMQALGTHAGERRAVRKALEALLSDGFLEHDDGFLRIRNFERTQSNPTGSISENEPKIRSAAAERKARQRERERQPSVTERDMSRVTECDMSRVTVTGEKRREDKRRSDRRSHNRDTSRPVTVTESHVTRDVAPPNDDALGPVAQATDTEAPPVDTDRLDPDRETPIPLDFKTRFPSSAIDELAEGYKVPKSAIEAELHEFATYWSIGAGAGKRRRNWASLFRRRVQARAQAGEIGSFSAGSAQRRDVRRQPTAEEQGVDLAKWTCIWAPERTGETYQEYLVRFAKFQEENP
jgi:hypothetical protein